MSGEKPGYKPQGGAAASFGERLQQLREAAGLTQEEFASRANLTAKAVSTLERGERKRPYPHTVRSLAEALGDQAWNAAHDEGQAMSFEEAVAYALDEDEALPE
jgi:transcriptional regulator with XRE-family HTH domain